MAKLKTESKTDEKTCAITKKQFATAKPMLATVNGAQMVLNPKHFESGTLGWFGNGTFIVEIDGIPVKVPFQVQAFVPNSKLAKD